MDMHRKFSARLEQQSRWRLSVRPMRFNEIAFLLWDIAVTKCLRGPMIQKGEHFCHKDNHRFSHSSCICRRGQAGWPYIHSKTSTSCHCSTSLSTFTPADCKVLLLPFWNGTHMKKMPPMWLVCSPEGASIFGLACWIDSKASFMKRRFRRAWKILWNARNNCQTIWMTAFLPCESKYLQRHQSHYKQMWASTLTLSPHHCHPSHCWCTHVP